MVSRAKGGTMASAPSSGCWHPALTVCPKERSFTARRESLSASMTKASMGSASAPTRSSRATLRAMC